MSSLSGFQGMGAPGGSRGQRLAGNKVKNIQQFTPEQMQLFQRMFSQVSPESYTSRLAGGDESLFNEMEAPALRQFGELQGNIASRFSGQGSLGSRRSSGFQNSINSAASDFAQDLQSKRQGLMRQAIQDLHGMSRDLLHEKPYEQFIEEPKKSKWQSLLAGGLPIAGAAAGGIFGGPAGAAIGAKLGSRAAQGFYS